MADVRKLYFSADHPDEETPEDRVEANRQTASLAGLAIALALVVAGLFLFRQLEIQATITDCLLTGRTNCPLITSIP